MRSVAVKQILLPALHVTQDKTPFKKAQLLQRNEEQGNSEKLTRFPSLKQSKI